MALHTVNGCTFYKMWCLGMLCLTGYILMGFHYHPSGAVVEIVAEALAD